VQLVFFRVHDKYPLLTVYLCTNLLQTAVGVYLYQTYGFRTIYAYRVAWTTQAIVVIARGFAAAEICHRILGKFKGVWALSVRILIACGGIVLITTLYFGARSYQLAVITLDMSLEACIATWIVGLLLFARYYAVPVAPSTGMIGLGLGLFSCCKLLNDLVFERHVHGYLGAWNYVSSAAFVGILLLWNWALRRPVRLAVREPQLNAAQVYQSLIPQVNLGLLELNRQLSHILRAEPPKP
jgi:hypothetical protein